jgi:hypothetical protein
MIISPSSLTSLQSCPRRFLLESDYSPIRIRPKALFDKVLRTALLALSNGAIAKDAAADARATFLEAAANPGMDLPRGLDSYKIALDWCAMLDTIVRAAAGWGMPALSPSPVVHWSSTTERGWQPESFTSPDGTLHRIVTVDSWSDADLSRELHSWGVFGDLCVTGRTMLLRVVEIGRMRNGRRASPWARAWRHPSMPNLRIRFARVDGTAFKGWTPYYLADHRDADPDEWVRQMEKEGVARSSVRELRIDPPPEEVIADTLGQMRMEATRGSVLLSERGSGGWRAQPMSRGACDLPFPCVWQAACHQTVIHIETMGLYERKGRGRLAVAER